MQTRKIAVFPGSFDPITLGHMDVILRGVKIFDEVWVAVAKNAEKNTMFSAEDRLKMVQESILSIPGVHAEICEGLLSDYMHQKGANFLIKGIRDTIDAAYEMNLSQIMHRFDSSFETVLLPAKEEHRAISSTYVRELIRYRQDLSDSVPNEAITTIEKRK